MPNKISPPMSKGLFADLILALFAIFIGLLLVDGETLGDATRQIFSIKVAGYFFIVVIALFATKSWQNVWRWTSYDDLVRVAQTILIAAIVYSIISAFIAPEFLILEPILVSFIMASFMMGARGFARLISGGGDFMVLSALFRPVAKDAPAAIFIGPTDRVTHSLHEFRKEGPLPFRPIAIISTSGNHINKVFAGAKVLDGTKIKTILPQVTQKAIHDHDSVRVILIGENHSNETKKAAMDVVTTMGVKLSRMPEIGSKALLSVNPQDVLGRHRHVLDDAGPSRLIRHKTVLITGAGGTIGGELSRQIAKFQPGHLIVIDSSENNLYSINQRLTEEFPTLNITPRLVDVREVSQINKLFAQYMPQIVIHAAANKHVPLMEMHPREAIRVNLGGTKNVADAALKFNSEVFVLISTDKAVNPSNMMGVAKRAAELYVRHCFEQKKGGFYSVRFGNVLGSSGSVMPLFERQISKHGPVTITHREMTRWFMTVEEAVGLVLQGAALGGGAIEKDAPFEAPLQHPLLVLDMGEPIRIIDFAEAMIRLRGYEPHKEIQIIETGPRPGEKLHEELFYGSERVINTSVAGIYCAQPLYPLPPNLTNLIENIIELAEQDKIGAAIDCLKKIVPETKNPTNTE